MKVISSGSHFEIYSDDLQTHDKLPAGTYVVNFNKMSGFSLKKTDDFVHSEEKVYGNHKEKVAKTIETFKAFDRSLGVILSGDKGIGKSMTTQMLSADMIALGYPVIIVDTAYVGISNFIESIQQEVLVLFDEFEKVFSTRRDGGEAQDALLGLFDGISQRKRLYAITVNNLHHLNEFMLNRPGRFHYHFRFGYPSPEEVRVYLSDNLSEEYHGEIKKVVAFSQRVRLNYDCLRAVAFELNNGHSFADAISDLNIVDVETQRYNITIEFDNGLPALKFTDKALDLFQETVTFDGYVDREYSQISFNPKALLIGTNGMVSDGEGVEINIYEDEEDNKYYNAVVTKITVAQKPVQTYSYNAV